jgi:hypothetical protein
MTERYSNCRLITRETEALAKGEKNSAQPGWERKELLA